MTLESRHTGALTKAIRLHGVGVLMSLWLGTVYAQTETSVSIEGLLVVIECRAANYQQIRLGDTSPELVQAATTCARTGAPLAVLVNPKSNPVLYTLVAPSEDLFAYIAHHIRLTGEEISAGLIVPSNLEVKTHDGWMQVVTTSMM
ncbi:MAG: hypothetical protein CMO26_08380 [Thiotrichales bacterium]|nr:hypothetical protein [Thiotrichales bacterium]